MNIILANIQVDYFQTSRLLYEAFVETASMTEGLTLGASCAEGLVFKSWTA